MAERTVIRRTMRYLAGGWLFAAASIVVFVWLTVGPYIRQNLRPLPGEAKVTLQECQADPSCARDAVDLVEHQVTLLRQTRTVVHVSAWSVSILAVLAMAFATVLILRAQRVQVVRVLGILWKVQVAWVATLFVVEGVMLALGASVLDETPEPARMFTFIKAFNSPFTDVGHLYYEIWLTAVGLIAALITRTLRTRAD